MATEVWPAAVAESVGAWVKFFHDEKQVFSCNASYAAANFQCSKITAPPKSK